MNLKNNEFLMLVVAFLLGYFAHRILKGCQIVEGQSEEKVTCSDKVGDTVKQANTKCIEKISKMTIGWNDDKDKDKDKGVKEAYKKGVNNYVTTFTLKDEKNKEDIATDIDIINNCCLDPGKTEPRDGIYNTLYNDLWEKKEHKCFGNDKIYTKENCCEKNENDTKKCWNEKYTKEKCCRPKDPTKKDGIWEIKEHRCFGYGNDKNYTKENCCENNKNDTKQCWKNGFNKVGCCRPTQESN